MGQELNQEPETAIDPDALDPDDARKIMRFLIETGELEGVELVDGDPHDLCDENPDHGSNTQDEMAV